eukprot:gnl/TRDRNA2_/TRDRNA2_132821_c0_seq4.p2 gnl/TRDRNA2_/TRDRNA2_132821_c0~~gnl/TRDRNA2_/TRDRNA2_132821_c0_seq4.p2  ORF type:complete len:125 (+),score=23.02 gnl/TRDRNA2_/TRDRNA2_132821_c0_seq4:92-466(+)
MQIVRAVVALATVQMAASVRPTVIDAEEMVLAHEVSHGTSPRRWKCWCKVLEPEGHKWHEVVKAAGGGHQSACSKICENSYPSKVLGVSTTEPTDDSEEPEIPEEEHKEDPQIDALAALASQEP